MSGGKRPSIMQQAQHRTKEEEKRIHQVNIEKCSEIEKNIKCDKGNQVSDLQSVEVQQTPCE